MEGLQGVLAKKRSLSARHLSPERIGHLQHSSSGSWFCTAKSGKAARILANLLVMGSGIMIRAFSQAYRQAIANASKNGVAQEALQNIKRGSKMMSEAEARQILGVTENSTMEEILKRYDTSFERNTQSGSFYLQSKVVSSSRSTGRSRS